MNERTEAVELTARELRWLIQKANQAAVMDGHDRTIMKLAAAVGRLERTPRR